ncbi:hypothetical protein [Flavobacterium sp. UBA6135]|uniref:hypothetical protein n=1 Tax=Flavobacterium sp. UBA6135 TaxID=1946553 RepID=UPI0025C49A0B|nr:hypothetical protein [Flavobacterium sp. UBA6135]
MKTEPNNIEKLFREKLYQREIQPSKKAWDRMDAMLSLEEQKPNRNYKWLSIAAGFIGFTLFGIFMVNKENINENAHPSNPIVLEKDSKLIKNETTLETKNSILEAKKKVFVSIPTEKIKEPKQEINPKKDIILDVQPLKENPIVENKIIEKSTNNYINPESLLAEITSDEKLKLKELPSKPQVKVDANVLLNSIENEVNESFRNKVIQTFNDKYNAAKSSLANRNHE